MGVAAPRFSSLDLRNYLLKKGYRIEAKCSRKIVKLRDIETALIALYMAYDALVATDCPGQISLREAFGFAGRNDQINSNPMRIGKYRACHAPPLRRSVELNEKIAYAEIA